MGILKEGKDVFRPKARLLVLLGEQLITNEVIAVTELAKNSYDADATEVKITLENITDRKKGQIIIKDNGFGMILDTILHVWLEPATDYRKKQRDAGKRTRLFHRLPLGEKGVGRFAVHKLGSFVELITKAKGKREEIRVEVDWTRFEKKDYLDRVPVRWEVRSPEIFKGSQHGTMITVKELRKSWNEGMVRNLYLKLQSLNSPFITPTDFRTELKAPSFENVLEKLPEMSEMLNTAVYKFKGYVNKKGDLTYSYSFYNPAFEELKRKLKKKGETITHPVLFKDGRKPFCGPFSVKFYVWDRDPATLREVMKNMGSGYFKNYISPNTGVRVYRDGFRVWPYGEEKDDWLGLDLRRVQAPPLRISRNLIIGIIEFSSTDNPELRDKTDREGLIDNNESQDFKNLVIGSITILEKERREDKKKMDELREKKRPEDEVQRNIDKLRQKMKKKKHIKIYKGEVKKIEDSYRKRMKEVIEPLIITAGLGIAYTLPIHEITRNVKDAEDMLNYILEKAHKQGMEEEIISTLNRLFHILKIVDDITRGAGKITKKAKPEEFLLYMPVKDALDIMKFRLKKSKISVEENISKVKIKGMRNMITTAVLNLLDNSAYWLLHRIADRKIIINVGQDINGNPRIVVSDNGPGIKDDPALLVEPFYSRKPDGSGLGLYIVERIMKTHEGRIEFIKQRMEKGMLEGANVALTFSKIIKEGGR